MDRRIPHRVTTMPCASRAPGEPRPTRPARTSHARAPHLARALPALLIALFALAGLSACSEFDSPARQVALVSGPPLYKSEPDIRVRVAARTQTAAITGPARFVLRPIGSAVTPDLVDGPITVTCAAGTLRFTGPSLTREFPPGMEVEVLPYDGKLAPAASAAVIPASPPSSAPPASSARPAASTKPALDPRLLRLNNAAYPGAVTFRADSGSAAFDAVAIMPLEDYLPGVLVKELWPSFPKAAFEAQAVASRSYALHERDRARREGRRFDVEASTTDQAYAGSTPIAVANNAVANTRGIVLIDKGQLLRAYFSSTCGGRPASAADTWPSSGASSFNKASPLHAARRDYACNGSKWYRWQAVRQDEELSRRIRAWGRSNGSEVGNISRIRSIKVDARNDADRPTRFALTDDRGRSFKIAAEDLRRACNHEQPDLPALAQDQIVRSGDFEADFYADRVNIRGRGYGHGVGLCQWCAKGFADRQLHYQEILARFYPGAQLRRAF